MFATKCVIEEPMTYEEVTNHPDWKTTMHQKHDSIIKNHMWDSRDLLKGKMPITNKWVFKTKLVVDGTIKSYKLG
jgi:hypothetical protein